MADLRAHGFRTGQSLVNADIVESRLLQTNLCIESIDKVERRISDLFIVVSPLPHRPHRIGIHLSGVRYVVTLPRVWLVFIDLLLDVVELALSDVQQPVS